MSVSSTTNTPFIRLADTGAANARRQSQRVAFLSPSDVAVPVRHEPAADTTNDAYDFTKCEAQCGVAKGTLIRTPNKDVPIESLKVGDLVFTADHGAQPIKWINRVDLAADGARAPVRIKDGALGNIGDLLVSPDFRVVLQGWRSTKIAGAKEVLTAAQHLVNDRDITRAPTVRVSYYHLGFDRHEVILANSTPVESLHPEISAERPLPEDIRLQLRAAFRKQKRRVDTYGPLTRPEVKPYEARLIRP